jgi:hypothetical protein
MSFARSPLATCPSTASIFAFVGRRLRVTIRTENTKIAFAAIVRISVDMIEFERNQLPAPGCAQTPPTTVPVNFYKENFAKMIALRKGQRSSF